MIKNYSQLAITSARKKVLDVINAGLKELDIKKIINGKIRLKNDLLIIEAEEGNKYSYDLKKNSRLFVLAIGKGSARAAEEIERIFGFRIARGIAIDIEKRSLKYIKSFKGTHPIPSRSNLRATKKAIEMVKQAGSKDVVLVFVFGGGSALFSAPAKISLRKLKKYTKKLVNSGKDIYSINAVRKHLSLVKGGQLSKLAYPAKVITCIVSDVPGNNFSFIASGPTVKDKTTIKDAQKIGEEFGWPKKMFIETPKEDKYFEKTDNILIFSNRQPLLAMENRVKEFGLDAKIYSFNFKGKAEQAGKEFLKILREKKMPQFVLAGGETTVIVKGKGKGGRNQELVLRALSFLKDNEIVASIASDGWDNTEAAGAIGDIKTKQKARKLGLNIEKFLQNNDSFHFFQKTQDLIFTDQGVNVADFILVAKVF